ncbi:MAG: hypothetical protein RIM84_13605 [Alphaproteobacteria bacterium]
MAVRLDKPWRPLTEDELRLVNGHLGVYELGDAGGAILYIGVADGRSLFGLKGKLQDVLAKPPAGVAQFRVEVNQAYHTRHAELLQVHLADHGELPALNTDIDASRLGRLRPG